MNNLVKICPKDLDISKTWYVEFYTKENGKRVRKRITGQVNRFNKKSERLHAIRVLQAGIQQMLNDGLPISIEGFGNDTEKNLQQEKIKPASRPKTPNISQAIQKVLETQKLALHEKSYKNIEGRASQFLSYLKKLGLEKEQPKQLQRRHIMDFLDAVVQVKKLSNRTRNNYLVDIKGVFNKMIELEIIDINPAEKIKKLNISSEKNAVYDKQSLQDILEFIKESDPNLYRYSCFLIYTLSRPNEVVQIKIKHIDFKNKKIYFPANNVKTNVTQYKPISEELLKVILEMKLERFPKDYFIFSASGIPSAQGTSRDYFTKKFQKVKQHFGLGTNYTMYGFKHTIVTNLIAQGHNHIDIMKLTGHKTLLAFEEYVRSYELESEANLGDSINKILGK